MEQPVYGFTFLKSPNHMSYCEFGIWDTPT